jgi:WD40 repeat protein
VYALTISSDGQTLASVGDDHTVNVWRLSTGERIGTFVWQSGHINVVAVGWEGQQLTCGESAQSYESPDIKVWDTVTGQELFNLKGHSRSIHSLAFSPDGKILASGSRDKSVKLWDMRTGELLGSLTGHTSDVNAVAFSPYGHVLATGSKDKTIKLWKLNSGLTAAKTGG